MSDICPRCAAGDPDMCERMPRCGDHDPAIVAIECLARQFVAATERAEKAEAERDELRARLERVREVVRAAERVSRRSESEAPWMLHMDAALDALTPADREWLKDSGSADVAPPTKEEDDDGEA